MRKLFSFAKRHTLLLGFLAVLGSLLLLIGFQFVWLARLEKMSALAHQAALQNYLAAVSEKIQAYYRTGAEAALDVPATVFVSGRFDAVAVQWRKRPAPWARLRFLVDYTREPFGNYLAFDEEAGTLSTPPASDESMAMIVACTPWQMLRFSGTPVEIAAPTVDERNPEVRMILRPVVDERSQLLGVTGVVLEPRFLAESVFPKVAMKAVPEFFGGAEGVVVTLRDGTGHVVRATGEPQETDAESVRLPFVFTDWRVGLQRPGFDPQRWARANVAFDIALTAFLSLALVGSVVLAMRAAGRAVRLSQMKSDFVSNVSHELRTPLASIRVFAELLKLGRAPSPEKVREYGEAIETESRRLSRLIENILDFSRIESGRKTYRFAEADLREVVAGVLKSFENTFRSGGFRVDVEEGDAPIPPVRMDAEAVGQAVQNLLENAVKYSGDSREVTVRLERQGPDVVLTVRDRGVGIPQDEQKKIFDRFHRVSTGLVHDVKGAGLGLSIVHHAVQAHGGRVTVDSEPGKGSAFRVRLPIAGPGPSRAAGGDAS